jgi:hypothetical protein
MESIPKINDVEIVKGFLVKIKFSDGTIKEYDFEHLTRKEPFTKLKNFGFFKNFKISPGGYALVWDDELDIAEYELWKNGKQVIN